MRHANQTYTEDFLRDQFVANDAYPDDITCLEHRLSQQRCLTSSSRALVALRTFGTGMDASLQGLFGRGRVPGTWANESPTMPGKPGRIVHHKRPSTASFPRI